METIDLIVGDSSDIFNFSSKQVGSLSSLWEGSWVISDTLGSAPELQGILTKNPAILNDDSLVGEEYRKSYKIFEEETGQEVTFIADVINANLVTVQGKVTVDDIDANGTITKIPVEDKYVYITLKGLFKKSEREIRVKSDGNGDFTVVFDLSETEKTPADSFFIFQIMPTDSAQLSVKKYYLSVEIRQKDALGEVVFRREVLQARLNMNKQGVL